MQSNRASSALTGPTGILPLRLRNAIPGDSKSRRGSAPQNGESSEKRPVGKIVPRFTTARSNTGRPYSTPTQALSNRFSDSYYDPNSAPHPDEPRNTTQLWRRESDPVGNAPLSHHADSQRLRMIGLLNSDRIADSATSTPPMNPPSASHPPSQRYIPGLQDEEHWGSPGRSARDSIPSANGWGKEEEQMPLGYYKGDVPQPRGREQTDLEWYKSIAPLPRGEQTPLQFDSSAILQRRATTGSEIPHMPQGAFQRPQYVNSPTFSTPIPESRSNLARTQSYPSTINRPTCDRQHSMHNYQPRQHPPEYRDFDFQTGMNGLRIHENRGESYNAAGNKTCSDWDERDRQSIASGTTNNSESTNPTDNTCSTSISEDDGPSSRRISSEPINGVDNSAFSTGIDVRRTRQSYDEQDHSDVNAFACKVNIWPNDPNGYKVESVTIKFDTQCQKSNWVSAEIVDEIGVTPVPLNPDQDAEFVAANGQIMTASRKITLWFESSQGGTAIWAEFLVSPVRDAPYKLLLGADDCLRWGIIQRPSLPPPCQPGFLALAPRKLDPNEKKEENLRLAQHAIRAQERRRLIQTQQAMQRQEARRTSGASQINRRRDDDRYDDMQARKVDGRW